MIAFSWTGQRDTHIEPMVLLHLSAQDLESEARTAATKMARIPEGRRCLLLRHLGEQASIPDLGHDHTWASVIDEGYATAAWTDRVTRAFEIYLDAGGPPPDHMPCEFEKQARWFQIKTPAERVSVWAKVRDEVFPRLPIFLAGVEPEELRSLFASHHPLAATFVAELDALFTRRIHDALRSILLSAWLNTFGRVRLPVLTNYGSCTNFRRDVRDDRGWRTPAGNLTIDGTASPSLYTAAALDWIPAMNPERSTPWIAAPDEPVTFEIAKALTVAGFKTLLYWNPLASKETNSRLNELLVEGHE